MNWTCCKNDYVVCTCMGVLKSEIIDSISKGDTTYEKLQDSLGVGTGCSSCVQEVHDILSDFLKKEEKK
jgi:bacterioferritin-associated ferredoxin